MGLTFQKNRIYSMPVFFGPLPEPTNPGDDGRIHYRRPTDVEGCTVWFETDPEMLSDILPDNFSVADPVVSVLFAEFANIGALAGHSYRLASISIPTRFDGERDHMLGDLVIVMYENHADPIIGGRDLIGYSKIYADISRFANDGTHIASHASNWSFDFLDIDIDLTAQCPDPETVTRLSGQTEGKFGYRYLQALPEKGHMGWEAGVDVQYPVANPRWVKPDYYPYTIKKPELHLCNGTINFHRPTFNDLPGSWPIVDYLSRLPIKKYLGALHSSTNEAFDYTQAYRLR